MSSNSWFTAAVLRFLAPWMAGQKDDYDGAETSTNRKTRATSLKSEDHHLGPDKRRAMVSRARDNARNFTVAAWAVRKHLDYITGFSFQPRTTDKGLNKELGAFVREWSRPGNFDVAERHGLRRYLRIAEARRTLDGDFFTLLLQDGRVQGLEGDRIRNPSGGGVTGEIDLSAFCHGIRTDMAGATRAYCVCKRTDSGGFPFERILPARAVLPIGYYDRIDQTRGISPFAPALNTLQDVYEGFDYALAKAKLSQLLGLIFYRESQEDAFGKTIDEVEIAEDDETTTEDEQRTRYEVDPGTSPWKLELDPGDKAEFLSPNTPAQEFRDYSTLMILIALKALDIPFSFFDESFTNFYGSKGGILQYQQSCRPKRADLGEYLDDLTRWRLALATTGPRPELRLPRRWTFNDVGFEWISAGIRPWDRLKEAKGAQEEIKGGVASPQQICRELDTDFFDNIDQIAEAMAYAKEKKVPLAWAIDAAAAAAKQTENAANAEE